MILFLMCRKGCGNQFFFYPEHFVLFSKGIEFSMPLDMRKRKSHDRVGDDVDTKQTNSKASSCDSDTIR